MSAVYEVTNSDAEAMLKKNLEPNAKSEVVRLRGLPFTCTEADVVQFFRGKVSWVVVFRIINIDCFNRFTNSTGKTTQTQAITLLNTLHIWLI